MGSRGQSSDDPTAVTTRLLVHRWLLQYLKVLPSCGRSPGRRCSRGTGLDNIQLRCHINMYWMFNCHRAWKLHAAVSAMMYISTHWPETTGSELIHDAVAAAILLWVLHGLNCSKGSGTGPCQPHRWRQASRKSQSLMLHLILVGCMAQMEHRIWSEAGEGRVNGGRQGLGTRGMRLVEPEDAQLRGWVIGA